MKPDSFDIQIFDLDDTLINTRFSYKTAQEKSLRSVWMELPAADFNQTLNQLRWLGSTFGSGNTELYYSAFLAEFKQLPIDLKDHLLERMLVVYKDVFLKELKTFRNSTRILTDLLEKNKKLLLVSNGLVNSQLRKLNLTGLEKFFPESSRYISESFAPEHKKPAPFMLLKAMEEHGFSASEAIYYGNTITDILAGQLAGVKTCYRGIELEETNLKIATPDWKIKDWDEYLSLILN